MSLTLLEDRMHQPVHEGAPDGANARGSVGNPACGDVVTIHLRIADGRIEAAGFDSVGSAYQLATASILCDCVIGQPLHEAAARTSACILDKLDDLPRNKHHLARLAIEALRRAVHDHGRPANEEPPMMSEETATAFVEALLDNGREWGTMEVQAMATAEGVRFPTSTVRFLAQLREGGVIAGRLDAANRSWRWSQAHDDQEDRDE